ncbi:MAG: hypothetical protein QF805_19965 [Pirellulaceae bacterium]|jgi:hypothetical protein|nr:hypothetical protein [Pirellulaceae bacterium]
MTTKTHLIFTVVSSLVVVGAIVCGVFVVGSPAAARKQRFDQQRLSNLQTIFREVQSLCHDPDIKDELKRTLPATLDELKSQARTERISLTDPETGERYSYSVKNATTYELCATFTLKRDSDTDVYWNHPAGKHCFTVNALDPP